MATTVSPVDSNVGHGDDPDIREGARLLTTQESGGAYGSDGETTSRIDDGPEVDYAGSGGLRGRDDQSRQRGPVRSTRSQDGPGEGDGESDREVSGRTNDDDDREQNKCGLMDCAYKLLNALPDVGGGEEEGSEEYWVALRHGAKQIVQLIIPVTICMAVVLIFQLTVAAKEPPSNARLLYLPFDESESTSGGLTFVFALVNAAVFITIIIVMTVVLVLLFKYRCYKAIYGWLLVASALLLFVISAAYFVEILLVREIVVDWFTFIFFLWNFGCMGLISIHWKGPLRLQQAYLILTSALVATVFLKYLPNWTTWIILAAISLYDLFAVLCPKGPLRILVETAKERNENIFPSLIYSSTMVWIVGMADTDDSKKKEKSRGSMPRARPQRQRGEDDNESSDELDSDEETDRQAAVIDMVQSPDRRQEEQQPETTDAHGDEQVTDSAEDEEPRGFKLGLGDFIFYSILVGRAAADSEGDWVIISSCFVAILIGLCMTSLILGIVRRALPALPISIFFGLIFYFSSRYLIAPFAGVLATTQVYI